MNEVEVISSNFKDEVLTSNIPVLVDFWAAWCGPCRIVSPTVSTIAKEMEGTLKVAKINVDESADLAGEYGVTGIPTLMLFREGEVCGTLVGVRPKQEILDMIKKNM